MVLYILEVDGHRYLFIRDMPESTLLMLVSALAGRENGLNAYNKAVEEKYRFFSFGDAMFIKE